MPSIWGTWRVWAATEMGLVVFGSVPGVERSWASLRRGEPRGGTGGGTRALRLLGAGVRCLTGGGARSLLAEPEAAPDPAPLAPVLPTPAAAGVGSEVGCLDGWWILPLLCECEA